MGANYITRTTDESNSESVTVPEKGAGCIGNEGWNCIKTDTVTVPERGADCIDTLFNDGTIAIVTVPERGADCILGIRR